MPTLVPGAGNWTAFEAVIAALGQIGSGDYSTATAVARWHYGAAMQHQTFTTTITIGVVAEHGAGDAVGKGGITSVDFCLEGGTILSVTSPSAHPVNGLWGWWVTVDASTLSDGVCQTGAIVYPIKGYCRVLYGAFDANMDAKARGENSLFLCANNGGTLPAAHVYCNVNTGHSPPTGDGSSGNPFKYSYEALNKLIADGTRDGATIHCTGGSCLWPNQANPWDDNDQYCTLSLEGDAVLDELTSENFNGMGCTYQRVVGENRNVNKIVGVNIGTSLDNTGFQPPWIWVDEVGYDGVTEQGSAGVNTAGWSGTNGRGISLTNGVIHTVKSAIGLYTHVSSVEMYGIAEDAIDNHQGLADDIYIHDQRQIAPNHSDIIQLNAGFGPTSHEIVENTIFRGIRAIRVGIVGEGVQGFFLRSNGDVGTHKDLAIVDCDFAYAGNSQILHDVDHLIIRHSQFLKCQATDTGGAMLIINDAPGGWPNVVITNLSVRNSVFDNLTATATTLSPSAWADNNHYISSGNYGTNATTGSTYAALFTDPTTETYIPNPTGSLAGRTASKLISFDINGTERVVSGAIGPYELGGDVPAIADKTITFQFGKAVSVLLDNSGSAVTDVTITDPTHAPTGVAVSVSGTTVLVSGTPVRS
jgi:hypothetical protein